MKTVIDRSPALEQDIASDINRIFQLQKANQQNVANSTSKERKQKLDRLLQTVLEYRDEIHKALHKDFRKHPLEIDLAETYTITSDIKHTKSHLSKWMRKRKVATPLSQLGASSYIHYEPKGVVLVISPWNFPFSLTLGPLVSAIAAGNCVMLKPSEHTPNAAALMKKMIEETFDENEVALIEGEVSVSTELLKLPFNHIFFTGAPEIGKVVMEAAAKNLASVTLELGGKSPTIVDETADLKTAAKRIAFGKWINNGQVCIAPDYVLVHESVSAQLIDQIKMNLKSFYGEDASKSDSYNRIVNHKHFQRVDGYLQDALMKGATISYGGKTDGEQDYIEPTVIANVPDDAALWKNEIFGPILPYFVYSDLQDALDKINSTEKPLALYIFSKNNNNINRIINNTRAGGTCINHVGIHYFNKNLPFGGSNNSGIGKGNGFFGFEAFSNPRAILKQWSPINGMDGMSAPYDDSKMKLVDKIIKWF